uniref:GAF domain-containing protein n=1 Tax=Hemiselmis andersenii TaxID=464988 RepID=A0A7S1GQM4_HEMAN
MPTPETASEPLQVDLFERWDELFFFKQGARENADHRAQYIAVPLIDLKGQVCGFLGVDTIHMVGKEQEPPQMFEPWRVDMLHAVGDCLGRALALSHGLAEDYDEMIGPTHFAKKIVEIIAGRSAENFEDEEPAFLQRFPLLTDLATRGCNVFGSFKADLPRKRYFTSDEEFAKEQLEDMKDIRSSLQEAIFAETRMRREIKLMCSLPAPPPETLKVWRTAIVLLGLKGDEVLNTDQSVAWDQVRYMLSEERPAKERMFSIVKDFDPAHPKQMDKSNEARYNLASGLTQTVRPKQLMKEGALSVLLYQWTLSVQWARSLAVMVRDGTLTYYKDTT